MAKGNYGAYTRLSPIQQDFGRNSDQQLAKFGMLKGQQDAQAAAQQQADQEFAANYADTMSGIDMDFTGIKSVDQINMEYINTNKQELGDMFRQLKKDPRLASDPNFMLKMANLKNGAKLIAKAQGPLTEYAAKLTAGMQDGSLSDANQQELAELEAIFGSLGEDGTYSPNYRIVNNEQGMPMMIGKTKDGRIFRKSLAEMSNGLQFGTPIDRADYNEYITNKGKQLGTRIRSFSNSGLNTTVQKFDYIKDDVRAELAAELGTPDDPSNMAKSFWVDHMGNQLSDLNEEGLEEIKDTIMNSLRTNYDESSRTTGRFNPPGQQKPEFAKGTIDPSKISLISDGSGEPMQVTSLGQDVYDGEEKVQSRVDIPGGAFGFALPQALSLGLNNNRKQINEVYLGADGTVYLKGQDSQRDEDADFASYKTQDYIINSKDNLAEVSQFARKMNLPNVGTLIKLLREQTPKPTEQYLFGPQPSANPQPQSNIFTQNQGGSGVQWPN